MMSNPLDFSDIELSPGKWVFLGKHDVERRARLYAVQNDLDLRKHEDTIRAFSTIYDEFDKYKDRVYRERYEAEEKAKNSQSC